MYQIAGINLYALSALVISFTSTVISAVVFLGNRRDKSNLSFSLLSIGVALWSFFYFMWQIASTSEMSLVWVRALMAPAIFLPAAYLHFVFSFLDISGQ